jgi:N-acetylgalactosamine PTS system EIIA component
MRSFRVVVAGHGTFPAALHSTTEMIVGPTADFATAGLGAGESPDHFAEELRAAIGHDGRRVLVLCDLLGGTPYNVASAIARRSSRVIVVAGVNLAMAVEAVLSDGDLSEAVVEHLLEVGRTGVVEAERHRARRAS